MDASWVALETVVVEKSLCIAPQCVKNAMVGHVQIILSMRVSIILQ